MATRPIQTKNVGLQAIYLPGHLIPTSDGTFDIGSPTKRIRNLYTSGSITLGGATLASLTITGFSGVLKATAGVVSASTLVNADVSALAAIDFSKLASLSSGNILVGSVANVATSVAMTGDVTISNAGVTAIGASKVTNAMLAGSIAYSKLSLTGAILNADLAGSIAYNKLSLTGSILNADLAGSIAYSKLSLTGSILNADLAGSIAYSKLSLTGAILDADLAGSISFSKLATLSSGNLLVGSVGNVATSVAVTGDVTISNAGVTAIGASKVTNTMLAGSIAYSKLSLTGAILNADLAGSIAYSKLSLTGAILNADLAGSIAYSKLSLTGAILNADLAGSIAYSKLSLTGAILNADLAGSIAYSKLVLTTSIVNGDIAGAAAIAGTKISPDFGSQTVTTTGTVTGGNLTAQGATGAAATIKNYAGDTNQASMSVIFTGRGNTSTPGTQVSYDAYFGTSSSNRRLAEIAISNTSNTVASSGGEITLRTCSTAGSLTTTMLLGAANQVYVPNITTTGSAANLFIDNTDSNNMKRFTSSLRYKKNISDLSLDTSKIFDLRPVEYDEKVEGIHRIGLIAEEVAEIFPLLVQYTSEAAVDPEKKKKKGTPEGDVLVPDGVQYALLPVIMLTELKKLRDEVNALKKK